MKKLLTIFLVLFAAQSFAQYPATQIIGSDSTIVKSKGALQGRIINWSYPDTAAANRERISQQPHAQIVVGNLIYLRDSTATKWVISQQGASNISKLNDSTLIITNLSGSDTFHTSVSISNWTVLSDTTVRVCDGSGSCDTVYTSPTVFAKSYVDSVIVANGSTLDTIKFYINGNAIVGGYIGGRYYNKDQIDSAFSNYYSKSQIDSIDAIIGISNQADGLISGGIVTWISGRTFDISASVFRKFGIIYYTRDTTITLDPPDANYNRIDIFALDTTNNGEAIKITGIPSPTPIAPQPLDYQIARTTGINLNVGDTIPANVSIQKIYDENEEWATSTYGSINSDPNNPTNPFIGSKDILVSSYNRGWLIFTRTGTGVMDGSEVLKLHISLKDTISSLLYVYFVNGSSGASSMVPLTSNNGFNPDKINTYQTVTIPISAFTFSNTSYNKLYIFAPGHDTSGTGGFYLDDIELQTGINNIPSQTDISGKVNYTDSIKIYVTPKQLADTIKGLHDTLNLFWPLYGNRDSTGINAHFRNDSIPLLTYSPDADTGRVNAMDVPVKKWVLDRISAAGGGTVMSVTGNPTSLVDNTDPANPVVQQDASKLDKSDSTLANRITTNTTNIASNTTAIAGKQDALTLTTTGTSGAATLTGATLNIPQYSGGGGSANDKQDSMNIYMPEKYGAKGDGVTDDAAAFTAMIAAMSVRGGHVHLMNKTYIIGSTITVDKPIWFEGSGYADSINSNSTRKITKIIGGTDNMVLFRLVEDHVTFSDMEIASTSGSTFSGCAIRADSNLRTNSQIAGFILNRVAFNGFYNQIEATGAFDWEVDNCHFMFYSNNGIVVSNNFAPDAGDSHITGCLFMPKNSSSFAGIYQTNSGGLRVTNNKYNWNSSTKGKYFYYGLLNGSSDLLIGNNSIENFTVAGIKIQGTGSRFANIAISANQIAPLTTGTRPSILLDSVQNISAIGNVLYKGTGNDTAILATNVSYTNFSNSYDGYGVPVAYLGTNTDLQGDGGAKYTALVYDSKGVQRATSVIKDSAGIVSLGLKNSGLPTNYINSSSGNGQLSFISNYGTGGALDVSLVNSNTSGGGFTFWQMTGAGTANNLLRLKTNGNVGFGGITNPFAYVDIPAGTGATNTGQIHLAPGKATNSDGYLSYDTAIGGRHLYFNIGGTQYRLDSQSTSGGTGYLLQDGSLPLTGNWAVGNHNITGVATLGVTALSASTVTGNAVTSNGALNGTNVALTQYNFGTGTTTGISLTNGQPATSGSTVQNSLMQLWQGSVWNGTSANTVHYRAGVFPIGGTNTSEWKLSTNLDAGAYSDVFKVKNDGRVTLSNVINLKGYTVATLPTGTAGDVAYVTDASSPTYLGTLTGGGSTVCPVFFNGTAWVAH